MIRFLAVAPHAWGRDESRKAAERKALRNVPEFLGATKHLLAVYRLEGERTDEVFVDDIGRVMLPPGVSAEKVYTHTTDKGA